MSIFYRASFFEKLDMLFMDVETEGRKKGYKKAAREYNQAFQEIESAYKETMELINQYKKLSHLTLDILIERLAELEKQKNDLDKQCEEKTKDVSVKFNVNTVMINRSCYAGVNIFDLYPFPPFGMLDLVYIYKLKKLNKAKKLGYIEARKVYEEKIQRLQKKMKEAKETGLSEVNRLNDLVDKVLHAIAEERMRISDLNILLKGDE